MNAIQIMKEEHTYIKRMLKVLRQACLNILEGQTVDYQLFTDSVDFIRNYADKYHHSKEEDVLFKKMQEEIQDKDTLSAVQGMFIEHDFGRLFIYNLVKALDKVQAGDADAKVDIIGNAIPYTDLLTRHIDKEDNALYDFGVKALSDQIVEEVDILSKTIDDKPENIKQIQKYTNMVVDLEKRVGI
ncbi:MAG: hemerythrin [Gracilibacter sp. BRH_c7a]|nr:MAG: hemerythrin [Gracilibacter sp. BRH_c7a]